MFKFTVKYLLSCDELNIGSTGLWPVVVDLWVITPKGVMVWFDISAGSINYYRFFANIQYIALKYIFNFMESTLEFRVRS